MEAHEDDGAVRGAVSHADSRPVASPRSLSLLLTLAPSRTAPRGLPWGCAPLPEVLVLSLRTRQDPWARTPFSTPPLCPQGRRAVHQSLRDIVETAASPVPPGLPPAWGLWQGRHSQLLASAAWLRRSDCLTHPLCHSRVLSRAQPGPTCQSAPGRAEPGSQPPSPCFLLPGVQSAEAAARPAKRLHPGRLSPRPRDLQAWRRDFSRTQIISPAACALCPK